VPTNSWESRRRLSSDDNATRRNHVVLYLINLRRGQWSSLVRARGAKVLSSIKEYQPGPQISKSIWMIFGLPSRGTTLHDLTREGLPFESFDRIASLLQVQRGVISKAICVSPTTLSRRAKARRF
jgi:hypothetical protein